MFFVQSETEVRSKSRSYITMSGPVILSIPAFGLGRQRISFFVSELA